MINFNKVIACSGGKLTPGASSISKILMSSSSFSSVALSTSHPIYIFIGAPGYACLCVST